MLKLAPSLLAADFSCLREDIKAAEAGGAHYLHLDVMDGVFVPNISFGAPVIKAIRKTTDMCFDVHLMITDPGRYVEVFAEAGADIINVHIEACDDVTSVIRKIKSLGKKAAVTIKPSTGIDKIYDVIPEVDMVLVMSVEPGFGGQELIQYTLKKAENLAGYISKNNFQTEIEMDGGIYLSNVRDVIDAGVNIVVAGFAVFGAKDIGQAVRDFYGVFNENGTGR